MAETVLNKIHLYQDYIKFPEGERIELINGQIYAMVPAPSRIHQKIISELITMVNTYI